MYCPKCLNNSLHINSRGVMHIIVNGKQMDAGRFLYNLDKDKGQFFKDLTVKLEEFFQWYSNFQNVQTITKIEISTSDVACDDRCHIPINNRFSIVDEVISSKEITKILDKLGESYSLEVQLIN